ncbi:AraC family transcriptional regulator [uncultured Eudoraea sp.]|uniref:GyrI-like domain-containing protein n=1 Tax=uncultured Eudoraea sp. TaxID=1035614 RepID=UPI00261F5B34|nr:AraC family transcriptional regulator [uncultured Eudoraea sp.]
MKKVLSVLLSLIIVGIVWYLFIKPYDYRVTFKTRTFPGTINQSLKIWNSTLEDAQIVKQEGLSHLEQKIKFNDSTFLYEWEIIPLTDSTSKVKVYVKDLEHSLQNKIAIPFSHTDFEERTVNTVKDFNEKLNDHISNFRVKVTGESKLPATYCAYVSVKTTQLGKAKGMMYNYPLLNTILSNNGIELNGRPFIEVTQWDMETDSIHYDFCYPIIKSDSLPEHPDLKYKQFNSRDALMAIYNGNYISSDRAWYALMNYATKNDLEVAGLPVEVFHNNPNMGGDALRWKAEVYLPLKNMDD